MSNLESDRLTTQHGRYDYRTQDALRRESAAREAEDRRYFDRLGGIGGGGGGGGAGGGGSGDGWTAIAGLLLFAVGAYLAFVVLVFIGISYLRGTAPWIYFYEVLRTQVNAPALGVLAAFLLTQLAPAWLIPRPRKWWKIAVYLALLPLLTEAARWLGAVLVAEAARLAATPAGAGLHWPLVELPARFPFPAAFWRSAADVETYAVMVGAQDAIVGAVAASLGYVLLRLLLRGVRIGGTWSAWRLRRLFLALRRSWGGRAGLVAAAVALLALGSWASASLLPMPFGYQTWPVVLVGLALGPALAPAAVILWTLAAMAGLPLVSGWDLAGVPVLGPDYGVALVPAVAAALAGLAGRLRSWGAVLVAALVLNAAIPLGIDAAARGVVDLALFEPFLHWMLLSGVATAAAFILGRRLAALGDAAEAEAAHRRPAPAALPAEAGGSPA